MLIVTFIFYPQVKIDFAKHIFQITFGNDSSKVKEMTEAVKDLLNELYGVYSAFCSNSTPSMCSESVLSGSYGGTSSSQRTMTEVSLVDVAGGKSDDTF